MQAIKTKVDELAALGKPLDHKELIEKVLEGLGDTYQFVIDAVNSRETPITFDEFHEKLIHKELSMHNISPSLTLPTSAHLANTRSNPRTQTFRPSEPVHIRPYQSIPNPSNRPASQSCRPFLGKCQLYRAQGHVVSECSTFCNQFPHASPPPQPRNTYPLRAPPPWQAQAHTATTSPAHDS
ncbi:hypothetical protein HRI_002392400 [Hibiscus trionum]|uniref:Uncharacterized protein n=1 Tax=Hibiscus trionum TaxID=183268 RepID=A0A9W7M4F8_HIBTR|nr:hypothetical protein HRI_002392400 [Hibiscus trionum]